MVLTLEALQATKHAMRASDVERRQAERDRVVVDADAEIRVASTIFVGVRRKRDGDNALAGLKSAFDGIAQALGVDDSRFIHEPVTFEAGPSETRIEVSVNDD